MCSLCDELFQIDLAHTHGASHLNKPSSAFILPLFMFTILINDILPVFSVLVLGFILGKTNVVSHNEATTLSRVAFILLQPPLIFLLLSQVNLETLQYLAIFTYGVGQALIFTMTYLLCRHILRHDVLESWLLGMTTIFVNSLL